MVLDKIKHTPQLPRTAWTWPTCVEMHLNELQAIVIDYEENKVMLSQEDGKWVLPGCLVGMDDWRSCYEPFYVIPTIQQAVESAIPLVFLRPSWNRAKHVDTIIDGCGWEFDVQRTVVLLQYTGHADEISNEYRWVPLQAANVYHCHEEAAGLIANEIEYALHRTEPRRRLAWHREGWFEKAVGWLKQVLEHQLDADLKEDVIFLRSWYFGAILQANTTRGRYFLKCTSKLANDVAYTDALAKLVPEYVATPIAVDEEGMMMVMADYGEILVPHCFNKETRNHFSIDMARLQQKCSGSADELIACGFADYRPKTLLRLIDELVVDPKLDMVSKVGKNEEHAGAVQYFRKNTDLFKEKLMKLIESGMPATVTHNDQWDSNAYKRAGSDNYMFFDWSEGYVSHPFISDEDGLGTMSYLGEWTEFGTMETMKQWAGIGLTFHSLVTVIRRLREVDWIEEPDTSDAIEQAGDNLSRFCRFIAK